MIVDAERVILVLQRTHPDAVQAAMWQVAYEELVAQRQREMAEMAARVAPDRPQS